VFVEQDQAAGMQAFMAGKIKVQGDMMKMMAMQTGMPADDLSKQIQQEIKDITA
jgi:putative sterol carrier protein